MTFLEQARQSRCCDFVLTAHHADDNAETMLLHLLRGTGLRGLTGIPPVRERVLRPFLHLTRDDLEIYAKERGIPWVEDETNQEDDAARNLLRHKVMPVLRELNPRAAENMTRTAELLTRDEDALQRLAENILALAKESEAEICLPLSALAQAPQAVESRVLTTMMHRLSGRKKDISAAHVAALRELIRSEEAKEYSLPYGMVAAADGQNLTLQLRSTPARQVLAAETPVRFGPWLLWVSMAEEGDRRNIAAEEEGWIYPLSLPEEAALQVAAWDSGDRMAVPPGRGSRSLKRLCLDHGISLQQRETLPVLRVNGAAAAVPMIGVSQEFAPGRQPVAAQVIFLRERKETHDEE